MKVAWTTWASLPPSALNGDISWSWVLTSENAHYYVVRGGCWGHNLVRVTFSDGETDKEMEDFMRNMLLAAELKYNDWKEKHGKTATV